MIGKVSPSLSHGRRVMLHKPYISSAQTQAHVTKAIQVKMRESMEEEEPERKQNRINNKILQNIKCSKLGWASGNVERDREKRVKTTT